jgi:hypothetical protein
MANKGNPNWTKGGPSPNPAGRGAPFAREVIAKAKAAPGSDGVIAYGGYVQSNEGSSRLTGSQKWTEFANAWHVPACAVWAVLRHALLSGMKWSLTENPAGGDVAKRGVEVVQAGLLDARLAKPWPQIAAKALMADANGFSLHAAALGRRKDGAVVYTDIAHRPPHTVERWLRDADDKPWRAVEQRISNGRTYEIPLEDCLYLVNDTLTDSPEGVGFLRLIVERLRRITKYERLEGSELFSSMGGIPIARAPLEEIAAQAGGRDADAVRAAITTATQAIEGAVSERIKSPETQQYLKLDSSTYKGSSPDTISGVQKWGIEIIKGDLQGLADIRKIISDLHLDVARMLGVEFAFIGGGDSAGTQALHESKTSVFAQSIQAGAARLAACADQQLVRRLVRANGLDPDVAAPYLTPAPIGASDVEKVARTLGLLNMAGLPPNHPAKIAVFEALDLPWQDEGAGLMIDRPRFPFGGSGGSGGGHGAPVAPAEDPAKEPAVDDVTEQEEEPTS